TNLEDEYLRLVREEFQGQSDGYSTPWVRYSAQSVSSGYDAFGSRSALSGGRRGIDREPVRVERPFGIGGDTVVKLIFDKDLRVEFRPAHRSLGLHRGLPRKIAVPHVAAAVGHDADDAVIMLFLRLVHISNSYCRRKGSGTLRPARTVGRRQ